MCKVTKRYVVFLLLAFLQIQCICNAASMRERARTRRGAGKLNVDVTAKEYMAHVGSMIAEKNGKPKDLLTAPTSVWCFLDKAIIKEEHRPKPTGEGGKCGAIGRFIFEWESVANITSMTLDKSIIRPYLQTIDRFVEGGETIPVNISVSLRLFNKNATASASATSDLHYIQTVRVTNESDGWLELDITPAVLSIWTPTDVQPPIIEVTLRMEVDCIEHKKVPFQFANPAEVNPSKTFRREKFTTLQPLLVVYLEDRLVKEKLYVEKMLFEEEKNLTQNGNQITITQNGTEVDRKKRSASLPACQLENFFVNFTDLHLDYVSAPTNLNIRRCSGDCSSNTLIEDSLLATNHGRIIANAKSLFDSRNFKSPNSTMYSQAHKNPCCVPVEYESRFLLLQIANVFHQQLFPEIVASKCGCR